MFCEQYINSSCNVVEYIYIYTVYIPESHTICWSYDISESCVQCQKQMSLSCNAAPISVDYYSTTDEHKKIHVLIFKQQKVCRSYDCIKFEVAEDHSLCILIAKVAAILFNCLKLKVAEDISKGRNNDLNERNILIVAWQKSGKVCRRYSWTKIVWKNKKKMNKSGSIVLHNLSKIDKRLQIV